MDSPLTTEPETRRFLAEFVRYVKPKVVVETGCHEGDTSLELSIALQGFGHLHTCDIEERHVSETFNRVLPYTAHVHNCTGTEMIRNLTEPVDVAFLDSGGELQRVKEAVELMPKLAPVAWVFLHDALQTQDPCYRNICALTNWHSLILPYGRGLAMFYIGNERIKNQLG